LAVIGGMAASKLAMSMTAVDCHLKDERGGSQRGSWTSMRSAGSMSVIGILQQCGSQPYSRAMLRCIGPLAIVALVIVPISGQSKSDWEERRKACIATLSSFAIDPGLAKQPQFPDDFDGVTLEYSSSGCYGTCPSFTMRIEKSKAVWEGHAFVRKKKKVEKTDFARGSSEFCACMAGR